MAQVTAGWATIHFRRNCAQEVQLNSAAKSGQRLPAHAMKQIAGAKRTIHYHGYAAVLRQR
jgi:hypothetical protein